MPHRRAFLRAALSRSVSVRERKPEKLSRAYSIVDESPVIHEYVGSPDVVRRNSDAGNVAVFSLVPGKIIIVPLLRHIPPTTFNILCFEQNRTCRVVKSKATNISDLQMVVNCRFRGPRCQPTEAVLLDMPVHPGASYQTKK